MVATTDIKTMLLSPYIFKVSGLVTFASLLVCSEAFSQQTSRRAALGWMTAGGGGWLIQNQPSMADGLPERFDVDDFLRTGVVAQPMGVSGQAGKSRPETGVVLRDGSEVSRDSRSGGVLAEILVKSSSSNGKLPVLASYSSPWPLASGTVFDVECRDPNTGDGAFLAVTSDTGGKSLGDLKDSFFLKNVFSPTGRFSSYGQPTDIKVNNSRQKGNYRQIDVSFATLSQSTQTEIPRRAQITATIPEGASQAVMLVGSASALRWKRGSDQQVASVGESFQAIPAPQTSLKVRAKERRSS